MSYGYVQWTIYIYIYIYRERERESPEVKLEIFMCNNKRHYGKRRLILV